MLYKGVGQTIDNAKKHPYRFTSIVLGLTTGITCSIILPVLGFGALGPVAGSIATGWQSSIGVVSSGSLFAFLQGAGMGGAALLGIAGVGGAGFALCGAASATALSEDSRNKLKEAGSVVATGLAKVAEGVGDFAKEAGASAIVEAAKAGRAA